MQIIKYLFVNFEFSHGLFMSRNTKLQTLFGFSHRDGYQAKTLSLFSAKANIIWDIIIPRVKTRGYLINFNFSN